MLLVSDMTKSSVMTIGQHKAIMEILFSFFELYVTYAMSNVFNYTCSTTQ